MQHEFKKLRNSLLKSRDIGHTEGGVRRLKMGDNLVLWTHWKDAMEWDRRNHTVKVYHKLTQQHIDPTPTELMRNHLAVDVLNSEMLHLMKVNEL